MSAIVQQTIPKMQQLNEQQFKGLELEWHRPEDDAGKMSSDIFVIYQIDNSEKNREYRCRSYEYQIQHGFYDNRR